MKKLRSTQTLWKNLLWLLAALALTTSGCNSQATLPAIPTLPPDVVILTDQDGGLVPADQYQSTPYAL